MDSQNDSDFMAMLTGVEDSRAEFTNTPSNDGTQDAAAAHAMDGETYRSGPTLVATAGLVGLGPQAHSLRSFADSTSVSASKYAGSELDWMAPAKTEAPFVAQQMQPFFQEDTVTQFPSNQSAQDIFNALLRAMKENEVMYNANREKGTIKLTAFIDHSRVEATIHVYRQNNSHLVRYGRNHGDRLPATRLFYTLANASGLVQLPMPHLLRKSSRDCSSSSSEPVTIFVDMLESMFMEEVLVGAQSLARACFSPSAAAPYAPNLQKIIEALTTHRAAGSKGDLITRDVVACLAEVVENVSAAALSGERQGDFEPVVETALIPLLQCAALPNGDAACARASLDALTAIALASDNLRKTLSTTHKSIIGDAVTGLGPCSSTGSGESFLKASARKFESVLQQN